MAIKNGFSKPKRIKTAAAFLVSLWLQPLRKSFSLDSTRNTPTVEQADSKSKQPTDRTGLLAHSNIKRDKTKRVNSHNVLSLSFFYNWILNAGS